MASQWAQRADIDLRLPPGWSAKYDPNQARYYFVNHATKKTTWNDPRVQQPVYQRPPEQIPLRDFSVHAPTQATSRGHSSTARSQETHLVELDDEDEEWRNALLQSAMANQEKTLSFQEKLNLKEKFKNDFKELEGFEVESALEVCDYDEDIARATLESQKDELLRKKKNKKQEEERRRREKEEKEKRKAEERRKEMERRQKELQEEREAAEREEERRHEQERRREQSFAQRFSSRGVTPSSTTSAASIINNRPKKAVTSNAIKQPSQQNTTRDQLYVSTNRTVPVGAQASLRRGPNPSNLLPQLVQAAGPNKAIVLGPQKRNRRGPVGAEPRPSLSQGPQRSLLQCAQSDRFMDKGQRLTFNPGTPLVTEL